MAKQKIRFGFIGLGLMGRELASATARWCHVLDTDFEPEIVGICDSNPAMFDWFESNFDTIKVRTTDYKELIASDEIDAIYCAVPHNLHEQMYVDIINAGKHLMAEKPFGIDINAAQTIMQAIEANPDVFVACSSEFPFFPGAQRMIQAINADQFGKIIDVEIGLLHSSDIDPNKPINWKRMIDINGEYGCMGDLGMHALHIPLRAGWMPKSVFAQLSNLMTERYTKDGQIVPCETWDNATLHCWVDYDRGEFPLTVKTYRIEPGATNTWFMKITGTQQSVSFSTYYPKTLRVMNYESGAEQNWGELNLGYSSAYPTISGGIFEFGFSDSLLQMWTAFCDELVHGRDKMKQPFYCATPQEALAHHRILTGALESHKTRQNIALETVQQ